MNNEAGAQSFIGSIVRRCVIKLSERTDTNNISNVCIPPYENSVWKLFYIGETIESVPLDPYVSFLFNYKGQTECRQCKKSYSW